MSKKQHVEFHRKIALRRDLLKGIKAGAIAVPYCGDGDIAAELYDKEISFLADIDEERVKTACARGFSAKVGDCDSSLPFPKKKFDVIDIDSYAYPYAALRQFFAADAVADRAVIFLTDGQRQGIKRVGSWTKPDGEKESGLEDITEKRKRFNFYWPKIILPWFENFTAANGYAITKTQKYLRKDMIYWGAIIEKGGKKEAKKPEKKSKVQPMTEEDEIKAALIEAAKSGNVEALKAYMKAHGPSATSGDRFRFTIKEIALAFRVNERAARNWPIEEVERVQGVALYDLRDVIEYRLKLSEPKNRQVSRLEEEQALLLAKRRERLEMQLAATTSKFIPAELVRAVWTDQLSFFRGSMDDFVAKLGRAICSKFEISGQAEIEALIELHKDSALAAMSQYSLKHYETRTAKIKTG